MTAAPRPAVTSAIFAALLVAVIGASVATQRLKRSDPIVERVYFYDAAEKRSSRYVSPNGDGRRDRIGVRFDLPRADRVTVALVDDRGDAARTLADDRSLDRGTHRFEWDGRTDGGALATDGVYRLRVGLRDQGRAVVAPRRLRVDTTPPHPRIVAVTPPTIVPGSESSRRRARIRFRGPVNPAPVVRVWRTDQGQPREVARFAGRRFRQTAEWDGTVVAGRMPPCGRRECPLRRGTRAAPDGSYAVTVTTYDVAGNAGSTHALPPRAGIVARSGVSVRYVTLTGSLDPVRAGAVTRLEVGPEPQRVSWRLVEPVTRRTLADGRGRGRAFAVRVPRDARPGFYVVRADTGEHRATWPLVVRRPGRQRLLAVVPLMTWQGETRVDSDRDGFPDTLARGGVPVPRPFAGGAPEAERVGETAPLVRFLDRSRARFDLTTDWAMARGKGPDFKPAAGIVFTGSARWLPEQLNLELRRYVERGGRVASFGTDAFRRRVTLRPGRLAEPSAPEGVNLFGERTRLVTIPPAPLIVNADQINLFSRTDGFVGLFARFERQESLAGNAALVAEAGRETERPAFVAYRLGRGLVVRVGTPEWTRELNRSSEVAAVTRRLWELLSE